MIKLYNSLSRTVETFRPINPPHVGMYTCGPTVYDFAHIGNFRTYVLSDLLLRTLEFNKYNVQFIMNLTDVGHLTGDNLGDADTGEDRMESSAKKQGKTAWEVAQVYTKAFLKDFDRLNLVRPQLFAKATDHIAEQIKFVQILEEKGFTYKTSDGIYFDTSKFPHYGKLSSLDQIQEGARVEKNPEKKNARDFALWKFSPKGEKRQMEWDSPWGVGFPGWHIECSAMSVKYLGDHFDIHVGGIDLKETHHPNEIAQAEAVTGHTFVNYWVHGAFILVDGKRMSKSLGNNYTVQNLLDRSFHPLALRYLYLQTHYRQEMNFTFEALHAAQNALFELFEFVAGLPETASSSLEYENTFTGAINDDLNMSEALSVLWEVVHSKLDPATKAATLFRMDSVLGLGLSKVEKYTETKVEGATVIHRPSIPQSILVLAGKRERLRKEKRYHVSDQMRNRIEKSGYELIDIDKGKVKVRKKASS